MDGDEVEVHKWTKKEGNISTFLQACSIKDVFSNIGKDCLKWQRASRQDKASNPGEIIIIEAAKLEITRQWPRPNNRYWFALN